jgi:hypothetical protein
MEALRDRIMHGCGTDDPWFLDEEFLRDFESTAVAAHWRKPLRVDETNQLAPTREVLARPGRP